MNEIWMARGAAGGAIIGISASLMLLLNGRVTGISGIVNGLMQKPDATETPWRALFIVGLVLGGVLVTPLFGDVAGAPSLAVAVVAGALVGAGTRLGNGCTSGHGVCGLSRLSVRSLAATVTFIATGALTVFAVRALSTGAP
jgi:uncharacterized membrane protein YedE/YeeE